MILDQATQSKVESFRLYAQFLSNKFDVEVRLDGTKAQTDGKIIYVPNIAGMDAEEISFLRSIILHEIGHVRYTPFTAKSRDGILSKAHFMLVNALEDSRIENLLMHEFGGAKEMFEKLYGGFVMDARFMDKVFGASMKDSDSFHVLACFLHGTKVKLENGLTFMRVINKNKIHTVKTFIHKNKIDKMLEEAPFKTYADVVDLATKIYNIMLKGNKDTSPKNNMSDAQGVIDNALDKTVPEMEKEAKELQKQLDKIYDDYVKAQKVLDKMVQSKKEFTKSIRPELDQIRKDQQKLAEAIRAKKNVNAKEKKIRSANISKAVKQGKIDKEQDKIDEIARQINDLDETEDAKKIDKLKDKSHKATERQGKHFPSIKRLREKIAKYQNELAKAQKAIDKLPEDMQSENRSDLLDRYKKNIARKEQLRNEIDGLQNEINGQSNEVDSIANNFNDTKDKSGKKIANAMKNIENKLNEQGVSSDIMPKFEEDKDWKEANKEQKKFDERASKESGDVCTNGAGFSKCDTRDMLVRIEKTRTDLKAIDLVKHFDEANKASKLDSFNDVPSEINNTEEVNNADSVTVIHRTHVPLTTEHDIVRNDIHSDGKMIDQIKRNQSLILSRVKNVFRQKFKMQKRDKWKGNVDEGNLDTRNLWKIATRTNDSLVMEVNNPKLINKVKATVFCDLSGSMDREENAQKIRELLVFLSEGLSTVMIGHEVIGASAPICEAMRKIEASPVYNRTVNSLESVVYKKFDDKDNRGIQNVNIKCADNSDSESLWVSAQRLIKQQSRHKVMFVVSDAKPFLSDANLGMMDNALHTTIKKIRQNGVKIYSFSFGKNNNGKNFYGDSHCNIEKWDDLISFLSTHLV